MLLECEFCGEKGMELKIGKQAYVNPVTGEWGSADCIEMKCVHCGVHEPCESDDLVGFMMEILNEKNYSKAMVRALKIIWEHEYLQDVKE
tara:strand:+ start:5373 stop:5642 length:270 start_codon:yes stop_codon:yes gene_type:complete